MFLILTSGRILELPGGEENAAIFLGKWLKKKKHDVVLMGTGLASVKTKHLSKLDIECEIIDKKKKPRILNPPYFVYMLSRVPLTISWIFKILLLNRKKHIKIIHAHDTGYAGLVAVLSGKILGIPVILTSHGIRHKTLETLLIGKFNKTLLKLEHSLDVFNLKYADLIIVVNSSLKKYIKKITNKKIEYIPNTIKVKNFVFSKTDRESIRKELAIDSNTKVVGYVGRLSNEKNLFTLLTGFADASEKNLIKLIIAGIGINEQKMRDYVKQRNIEDKVIFCGFRHDIPKILSSIDIFVIPSFIEGLPTALLEAMAAARAIICSNIPPHKELVVHEREGLIINPNKPEELKNAIDLLCNNDSLREKLGNNAKKIVEQFDEELIFPKILESYRNLLDKQG